MEVSKTTIINTDKINCGIENKTDTKSYINKYSNSKLIFDYFNKNYDKIDKNILVNLNDLLVVFDSNTNINYYHKIFCDAKTNKIINYYNEKYNFNTNLKYEILSSSIKLKYSNNNLLNLINEFVLDYTLNFLEIKRISKKITNEIITNTIDKLSNNKKDINKEKTYQKKYIKYKLKYLKLKKNNNHSLNIFTFA